MSATEPPRRTLRRGPGQRLHLVAAPDWRKALREYQAGGDGRVWAAPTDYRRGDLLLTVLAVPSHPMLLCLERAASDPRADRYIEVGACDDFSARMPSLRAVAARLGRQRLPRGPVTLGDRLADELLLAIDNELAHPTPWSCLEGQQRGSFSRYRSEAIRAAALAAANGICRACGHDYASLLDGIGECALEVAHVEGLASRTNFTVETIVTDVVVLCASCHKIYDYDSEHHAPSLEELQLAWAGHA